MKAEVYSWNIGKKMADFMIIFSIYFTKSAENRPSTRKVALCFVSSELNILVILPF